MLRYSLLMLSLVFVATLCISGCAGPVTTAPPTEEVVGLEPYILVGESGRSGDRTASDIIGQLFMRNYQILGRYNPAGDPNRFVIVVANRYLLPAVPEDQPTAAFAVATRIAVTQENNLTWVSFQNPEYWANAFYQDDYPVVSDGVLAFKQDLMEIMPQMRGLLNRPFGGSSSQPLTPEALRTYRYTRQSESLDDLVVLAEFNSFNEALATVESRLADSQELSKVFELTIPGLNARLFGIALGGEPGEDALIALLAEGGLERSAGLPYELLVLENKVVMLPVRYRLPLSFPAMDRDAYSQVEILEQDITALLKTLVD